MSVIGLSSCSDDLAQNEPMRSGEVDITLSTTLPQGLQSYGTASEDGGLTNLENSETTHSVRYVLEIYAKGTNTPLQRIIQYKKIEVNGDYKSASFDTRLLAAQYNFVFYADIVRSTSSTIAGLTGECYYNSYFYSDSESLLRPMNDYSIVEGNLQTICATASDNANLRPDSPEMYDVYTCSKEIDLRSDSPVQSIILTRPFAKLRLITTDIEDLGITPKWEATRVDINDYNPEAFNALTGKTFTNNVTGYWIGMKATAAEIYENDKDGEKTLYVFYLPVDERKATQDLTLKITVKDQTGKDIVTNVPISVDNVPLSVNKLTTIRGNLLTKHSITSVTIDEAFVDDEDIVEYGKEADSVDELKNQLSSGTTNITYTGPVSKESGFTFDFDDVEAISTYASENPLFSNGNNASVILNFASVEKDAIITIKGENSPANLRIVTGTKCSLVLNMPNSKVYYDGDEYKYIVTNTKATLRPGGLQFEAMFSAGDRFSPLSYDNAHQFKLNDDFTLQTPIKCVFVSKHEGKTCSFVETLENWISNNPNSTMIDFVEANK